MKTRLFAVAAACLAVPLLASAAGPQLQIPSFPELRGHATESVDLTLGWMPLHLIGWIMKNSDDPDAVQVRETLKGLKSVQIRSYEFDSDYAYPQAAVDRVRAQLSAPGWSPLVQVRKRGDQEGRGRENVDIYIALEDKKVKGLVIIASEPREFTIVNIVGTIELEQIESLSRTFAHPGKALGQLPPQA